MTRFKSQKLASAATLILLMSSTTLAFAQETPDANSGEFLGTLTLGESKRDVQTDTATPETVIDQAEIDDRQASTVAELIDSVPGVTLVNGSTPTGSGINIRGFGANGVYGTDQKVAIQVDGASVGSEELYRIGTQLYTDPSLYKSASVIRGTIGSFEYGSGIIGGVVRLETIDASDMVKEGRTFAFRQTLGTSSNESGFNSSSTLAFTPTEGLELLGNFSWREQESQEDGAGNLINNSAFELPSYLLKAKYTTGDHVFKASYTNSETSDRDVPYDTYQTTSGFFGNVDRDTVSETFSAGYNYDPASDLVNLEALVTYANQEIDQEYVAGSSAFAPPGGYATVSADHQYETTKFLVKNTASIEAGALSHELRTGAEIINKDRLLASSAPGGSDKRFAVFAIDNIDFGNGFSATPAMRYESSELEGTYSDTSGIVTVDTDAVMGGLSLRYEFDSGLALFASAAHTESLPILDDLQNAERNQTGVYTFPRPSYDKPEVADTIEFGASFDTSDLLTPNDNVSLKVNGYQTEVSDVTSYSGVSAIDLEGIEIEGSYALKNGFYADLNMNIISAEDTRIATVQDINGNTVLNPNGTPVVEYSSRDWQNTPANSLRLTTGKRVSELLDVAAEFVASAEKEINGTETPGYLLLNLRANISPQQGLLEGMSLRVGVENAFDHKFTPVLATRPAPGRNIKFSIAKTF